MFFNRNRRVRICKLEIGMISVTYFGFTQLTNPFISFLHHKKAIKSDKNTKLLSCNFPYCSNDFPLPGTLTHPVLS